MRRFWHLPTEPLRGMFVKAVEQSSCTSNLVGGEAEGVEPAQGVGDVGVGVGCGGQAEGVGGVVAGGLGVVVAMIVVVCAGFGVVILAGETQRAVDVLAGGRLMDAPQRGPGLPGKLPVGVNEFGRRADQIGDDGVEPGVEPRLPGGVVVISGVVTAGLAARSRVGRVAFGLGERPETARLPVPAGDPGRRIVRSGVVVLFGEHHAVPGEHDPFDHPAIIGGTISAIAAEALLGDPPTERVVPVTPAPAVRGGHTGEPIVGIPAVAPGTRLPRQPLVLAQRHPALAVVLVADAAGTADQRAGVLPTALRGLIKSVTLCR